MISISESSRSGCLAGKFTYAPDHTGLRTLASDLEREFRVPVAYVALLQPEKRVFTSIGSGPEHWNALNQVLSEGALQHTVLVNDAAHGDAARYNLGGIRFLAATPLRTGDGLEFGYLVIADTRPRPGFTSEHSHAFAHRAGLAGIELEASVMSM